MQIVYDGIAISTYFIDEIFFWNYLLTGIELGIITLKEAL